MTDDDSADHQDLNREFGDSSETKVSSSKPLAIPSGDGDYPGGGEVVVDEDSSQVMSADSLVQSERNGVFNGTMLLTNVKHNRLQRRHRCFIASLSFVALLLLTLLIAVPIATKMQKNKAKIGRYNDSSTLDFTFVDSDDAIQYDDNEIDSAINEMFTAVTPTTTNGDIAGLYSNSKEDEDIIVSIHNIDNGSDSSNNNVVTVATHATTDGIGLQSNSDEKEMNETANEDLSGSSTLMPQSNNVETLTSTSSSVTIANQIDQNTGEEIITFADSVDSSTKATDKTIDDDGLIDTSTVATKSTLISFQNFKEPIDLVSTVINIMSNDDDIDMEENASNDVSLSAVSTIEPSVEVVNVVENHSLDGLISPFMSPNERTDRESQWLKAHNVRRKQWHTENNVTYVPLRWSTGLTSNALLWAQILIDQEHESFQLYHDDTAEEGENLAMNCGTGSWSKIYPPENILTRWVEEEIGLSPPDNLHLTQVLWRATKFVGCADASRKYDNGKTCHVQVCRYSKAGNCNLGKYLDWIIPMLLDDSQCGFECTSDAGCV